MTNSTGMNVGPWRDMSSAPQDGRWFCACDEHTAHAYRARWDGRAFQSEAQHIALQFHGAWSGWPPTKWTELPDPPWMVPLTSPASGEDQKR